MAKIPVVDLGWGTLSRQPYALALDAMAWALASQIHERLMSTGGLACVYACYHDAHDGEWGKLYMLEGESPDSIPPNYIDAQRQRADITLHERYTIIRRQCQRLPLIGSDENTPPQVIGDSIVMDI